MSDQGRSVCVLLALFLCVLPVSAQIKLGESLSLGLSGDLGLGYSADSGNTQLSDHSYGLSGDANMSGYYYNPSFLNYHILAMYNRSQANSGTGSITDASNIGGSVGLFSGSHFPGSISFGKSFNTSSTYGLPGVQGFATHGDSTQFGVSWSEVVPGLPALNASYTQGTSDSTAFGTSEKDQVETRALNLTSSYRLRGWFLNGRFTDVHNQTELPQYLTGISSVGQESSKSFNVYGSHKLPMQGSTSFSYSYGSFDGGFNGESSTGSNQSLTASAGFIPTRRLSSSFGFEYDTSLSGSVEQSLINSGSISPVVNLGGPSHSLSLYNFDNLSIMKNLDASFSINRIQQNVYGQDVGITRYTAVVNYHYEKPILGMFAVYAGVNNETNESGNQGTGLVGGVNFARKIKGFELGGGLNYSQNVQTVVSVQTTSSLTYLANARRTFTRHLIWNSSFSGYHSGFSEVEGSSNHSESYASTLQYRNYSATANYEKSFGAALATANGLVSVPVSVLPVLSSNQYLLESGSSYGFTVSASPVNKLSLNANYNKAMSTSTTPTFVGTGSSKAFTFYTQYQLRKISASAGYTRLMQGAGTATLGTVPGTYTSYYVGIQRWFNFF